MSNKAQASDPGGVRLDPERLRRVAPELFGLGGLLPGRILSKKVLEAHLWNGDSRAAVVLGQSPLLVGPSSSHTWANFHPVIADFVAADRGRVERRKARIGEPEWARARQLGQEHLAMRPGQVRDGAPHRSGKSA